MYVSCICIFVLHDNSQPIHTYVHGHYSLSEFLAPLLLCVFITVGPSLMSTATTEVLRNFFMVILFIVLLFARNLLRLSCRRNIFSYYVFSGDYWPGFSTVATRLIGLHTIYYTTAATIEFIPIQEYNKDVILLIDCWP